MKRTLITAAAAASIAFADPNPLFPILMESGSIQQAAFNGGGAAIADKADGASINPASLYGYHKLFGKRIGAVGSYFNEKEGRIRASAGISGALDQQNVVGASYAFRNSREGDAPILHHGTITYASLVREERKVGLLAWGINLNYLNSRGAYEANRSLPLKTGNTVTLQPSGIDSIDGWNQAASADLGFYQIDTEHGINYALVMENIVGYQWRMRDKTVMTAHRDSVKAGDTAKIAVDSTYYSGNDLKESGWIDENIKSVLVGVSFNRKIARDKLILTIPFDVRFWGLMNKDLRQHSALKNRCMVYTGTELNFGGALSLRGGYSWAPKLYWTNENGDPKFDNDHHFSGGARISFNVVDLEMSVKKGELAGGASLYF